MLVVASRGAEGRSEEGLAHGVYPSTLYFIIFSNFKQKKQVNYPFSIDCVSEGQNLKQLVTSNLRYLREITVFYNVML